MLHFGYICRATCELFLFARLSREGTEDYSFPYLLLGGGEGCGWGRESKTIKKKSLRKLKFLQWAKSVPPLLSSFLFTLGYSGDLECGTFPPASGCLHVFFPLPGKFFYNFNPTLSSTSNPFNLLMSHSFCRSRFKHPFLRKAFSDPPLSALDKIISVITSLIALITV